jgi:hypothetical protein
MKPIVHFLILLLGVLVGVQCEKLVIGVDGGTESIRACCFNAENGQVVGEPCAVPYATSHPKPGWAEQQPQDWYDNLGLAVRGAMSSIPWSLRRHEIVAISGESVQYLVTLVDGRCYTVHFLNTSNVAFPQLTLPVALSLLSIKTSILFDPVSCGWISERLHKRDKSSKKPKVTLLSK